MCYELQWENRTTLGLHGVAPDRSKVQLRLPELHDRVEHGQNHGDHTVGGSVNRAGAPLLRSEPWSARVAQQQHALSADGALHCSTAPTLGAGQALSSSIDRQSLADRTGARTHTLAVHS